MKLNNLNRREFAKLTAAAVGGVVAGTTVNGVVEGSLVDENPAALWKKCLSWFEPGMR